MVTSKSGPVMPAVCSGGVPGQRALWQLVSYRLPAEACIPEMQRKAVLWSAHFTACVLEMQGKLLKHFAIGDRCSKHKPQ